MVVGHRAAAIGHPRCDEVAVIELDVDGELRRRGFGRGLINQLLSSRPEPFATLAATVEGNAHAMYLRWGLYIVGRFRDEPIMDALVKDVP
jgi:hypothetical protein